MNDADIENLRKQIKDWVRKQIPTEVKRGGGYDKWMNKTAIVAEAYLQWIVYGRIDAQSMYEERFSWWTDAPTFWGYIRDITGSGRMLEKNSETLIPERKWKDDLFMFKLPKKENETEKRNSGGS